MVTSVSDREPQLNLGASNAAGESARLTVTGLDEKGQMFRETAPILSLDGRDCSFRSKFQPELGSWVLVELDLSKNRPKTSGLQGKVKSVQAEGVATNLYLVAVELESAQDVKIGSNQKQPQATVTAPQPVPVLPSKADSTPSKTDSTAATKIIPMAPAAQLRPAANIQASVSAGIAPSPPSSPASPQIPPTVKSGAVEVDREAVKSSIASEIKEQLAAVKDSFRKELEQTAQRTVMSGVEQIVRQTIEKQISANFQSTIQTLNSDLTHQLVGRLAGDEELRVSLENMAKKTLDEQIQSSRNSAIEAQQNVNSRAAELTRSIESAFRELENRAKAAHDSDAAAREMVLAAKKELDEQIQSSRNFAIAAQQGLDSRAAEVARTVEVSLAELDSRIKVASDGETAAQQRMLALEKEVAEAIVRFQKALEQLNHTAQSTIEKFDGHVTAQLNSWSSQFKNHLEAVSKDKAMQFTAEMQQQLTQHRQQTNEILEKLSAGLQLAQGTARMQEEQLAEFSRDAAANFEAEIRAVLLRLAGPA